MGSGAEGEGPALERGQETLVHQRTEGRGTEALCVAQNVGGDKGTSGSVLHVDLIW